MNLPPNTSDYVYARAKLPKQFVDVASPAIIAELALKPVTIGSDVEQRKVIGNVRKVEDGEALLELDTDMMRLWGVRPGFAETLTRVGVIVRAAVSQGLWRPMRVLGLRLLDNLTETASDESQPPQPRPTSLLVVGGIVVKLPRLNTWSNPTPNLLDPEVLDRL